jgi:pyrimidine deaminase RibD-like protein/RNA-binding protein YhbY
LFSSSTESSTTSADTDDVTTARTSTLSDDDRDFLAKALEHAKIGHGHTFPNPAVGCVLVRQDTGDILGAGFHPKAGYPHAEIFALLEAAGHVESGVAAARSVVEGSEYDGESETETDLGALMEEYTKEGDGGPERLFGDALKDVPVTAYVTLEPCCHYGETPPCAASLSLAGVDRVVVGFRDPNPKVDGGGVKVLEDAGITVDMAEDDGCAKIVDSFVKRILPKDYDSEGYSHVTGVMRRGLRKLAGQRKAENTLQQVAWSGRVKATTEDQVDALELCSPEWMEHLDDLLWREELVNLRLNKAVKKKKLAKQLGYRLASTLGAHVAQVVGHTVLVYRPAMPNPVLDLEDLAGDLADDDDDDDE